MVRSNFQEKDKMTEKPDKQVERRIFPSKDNQFKPGQSGNPKVPSTSKTQLWRYFTIYMGMSDQQIKTASKKALTQSQQAAMKLVEDVKDGKFPKSSRFVQYCVDRELGKPKEHVQIDSAPTLSAHDCEAIRKILRDNANRN